MTVEILIKPITVMTLKKANHIVIIKRYEKYNHRSGKTTVTETYEAHKLENNRSFVNTGYKKEKGEKIMDGWIEGTGSPLYVPDRIVQRINDYINSSHRGVVKDVKKSGNFTTSQTIVKMYY